MIMVFCLAEKQILILIILSTPILNNQIRDIFVTVLVSATLPFTLNLSFIIPTRYRLTTQILPEVFTKTKQRIQHKLLQAQAVSVTLDG
ncbi:hypothetical protein BpHYR1_027607 [Brachionus plicatilis]|uniref:Uncharacterized protein n=1 Tax=Brachionus plicatilis TaxID=10195 RepID=A0A3M7Q898_BRAPC|nr:hypothetical protein BpHYR1_027607 [Brachionus plicatilis]